MSADIPDGLLEVGRFGRPHGVMGDIFLDLTTDRVERASVGSTLWADGRWLTIASSQQVKQRWRVHLDGVDGRHLVERLTGQSVYAEPIDDPDALWVHEMIGARVVETDGTDRGVCRSVVDNPASDLLELDGGALVPATFVTSVVTDEAGDTTITIDPPDGLFELFEG